MTPTESYGAFAYAYDQALGETFFLAVRRMLDETIEKYPSIGRTHLDVACGTGYAIEYFSRRGFQSYGVDASVPMLAVARKRAHRLAAGDFRALPFRGTFARITCLYDSFNHIQERAELVEAFTSVARLMSDQSLFLFDMNHPEIYPAVWGMRDPFVASGADYHLEIATKYRKREKRGIGRVTGWAMLRGERVDIRETHEQRAWSEREIREALDEARLEPLEVVAFDPFQEIEEVNAAGVKLFFVCKRRSR